MNDVAEPQLRSAAEAILIVADEPVTTSAIAEALGVDERAAEELLDDLAAEYRGETPGSRPHGFLLTAVSSACSTISPSASTRGRYGARGGSSSRESIPRYSRNSPVVRYRIAPEVSAPASSMRPRACRVRMTPSTLTPRIWATRPRVTGCR